jgi:hypothetical protein
VAAAATARPRHPNLHPFGSMDSLDALRANSEFVRQFLAGGDVSAVEQHFPDGTRNPDHNNYVIITTR